VRAFAALYRALDETTSTAAKVRLLAGWLGTVPPRDAAWAVHFLIGRRPKRLVRLPLLRAWAAEAAGVPPWLFDESYQAVGDLAETVALLMPGTREGDEAPLAEWVERRLLPLAGADLATQRATLLHAWRTLGRDECLVWNKLITGAFRVGLSDGLVVRALARHLGRPEATIAHRLMGPWDPADDFLARLAADDAPQAPHRPYPFCLAHPLDMPPAELGAPDAWVAEWKWDGIRAQLVRRAGRSWLWSRGEELLDGRFPEVETAATRLPDGTVLDGELLPWRDGPLPFAALQRRVGRTRLTPALLREVPVVLVAYDLLESGGADLRDRPLAERRARLAALLAAEGAGSPLRLSPLVPGDTWAARAAARDAARTGGAEGLMLKRAASPYHAGRRRGDWWKWKVDPYTMDAVLVAAQPGRGRRAGLFTDYTFGVWDGDALVPVAKAYSGLTDAEIRAVDAFVRRHTVDRYGPVRAVAPELVFELAFEGIQRSTRHRSGLAVRFPRIARWRTDKPAAEADTLATLRALVPGAERAS